MHATSPPMPPTMVVAHSLPELPSFQIAAQSYPRIVVPPVPLIVVEPPPVQLRLAVHDTPGSASIVTYAEVVLREWVVAQPATAATTSGAIQRNLTDQPLGCVSTDAEFNVPSWSSRLQRGLDRPVIRSEENASNGRRCQAASHDAGWRSRCRATGERLSKILHQLLERTRPGAERLERNVHQGRVTRVVHLVHVRGGLVQVE